VCVCVCVCWGGGEGGHEEGHIRFLRFFAKMLVPYSLGVASQFPFFFFFLSPLYFLYSPFLLFCPISTGAAHVKMTSAILLSVRVAMSARTREDIKSEAKILAENNSQSSRILPPPPAPSRKHIKQINHLTGE
jgi:hypothetical protein